MKFDYVTNRIVKHEKARGLFDGIRWFCYIDEVKYGSEDFVHSLHVLYSWIQFRVNVEYSSHIVVPIGLFLQLFIRYKSFVFFFILSIYKSKFLSSCVRKIRQHNLSAHHCKKRKLSVGSRCIFLDLLP